MNTAALSPALPKILAPFVTLSYPVDRPPHPDSFPNANYYDTGRLDAFFIVTCIAVFAIVRDISRVWILEPFARWKLLRDARHRKQREAAQKAKVTTNGHANGVANGNGHVHHANGDAHISVRERKEIHRKVLRFAEQGWCVIYYTLQWAYGLYVYRRLPASVFSTDSLWLGYPHIPLAGPVKFYYLTQTAFYMHLTLVLNAEARRADHWQMMTHHAITVTLMVCSYFYNFTRVGCMIMVLMDWCDIWLPLAKMIRYIGWQTLCDGAFVVFLVSWFVTRHVFFGLVIKSAYLDSTKFMPYDWIPERGYWFTREVYIVFVGMLVALQILQILWFVRICQVAWKVVSGQGAEDNRSDSEIDVNEDDDGEDEEEDKKER